MNSDCQGGFWRLDGCAPSRYSMKIHSNSPTLKMKSAYVNCMEHHCSLLTLLPSIKDVSNSCLKLALCVYTRKKRITGAV
jgi:hypothetical protein